MAYQIYEEGICLPRNEKSENQDESILLLITLGRRSGYHHTQQEMEGDEEKMY